MFCVFRAARAAPLSRLDGCFSRGRMHAFTLAFFVRTSGEIYLLMGTNLPRAFEFAASFFSVKPWQSVALVFHASAEPSHDAPRSYPCRVARCVRLLGLAGSGFCHLHRHFPGHGPQARHPLRWPRPGEVCAGTSMWQVPGRGTRIVQWRRPRLGGRAGGMLRPPPLDFCKLLASSESHVGAEHDGSA